MFVLTRSINEYNQDGDYLVTVYDKSPTLSQLSEHFYKASIDTLEDEQLLFLAHIKRGGGVQGGEDVWYYLKELQSGKEYVSGQSR